MKCVLCKTNEAMHDLVICFDCLGKINGVPQVRRYITMRIIYDRLPDDYISTPEIVERISPLKAYVSTLKVLHEMERFGLLERKYGLIRGNKRGYLWRKKT